MVSAADAVKAWLAGPTIAECASVLVAIQLDAMRAAMGDDKFDLQFSTWPDAAATRGLLTITQFVSTSSAAAFVGTTDEPLWASFGLDTPGNRSVIKGEWYYFYNHPKYLLKHPGGAFQGENAICMNDTRGAQTWAGFGVAAVTEAQMMTTMAGAYNAARNERDYEVLLRDHVPAVFAQKTAHNTYAQLYAANLAAVPAAYRNGFADQTDAAGILAEAAYTIGGTERKGGFVSGSGKTLKVSAVVAERNR